MLIVVVSVWRSVSVVPAVPAFHLFAFSPSRSRGRGGPRVRARRRARRRVHRVRGRRIRMHGMRVYPSLFGETCFPRPCFRRHLFGNYVTQVPGRFPLHVFRDFLQTIDSVAVAVAVANKRVFQQSGPG